MFQLELRGHVSYLHFFKNHNKELIFYHISKVSVCVFLIFILSFFIKLLYSLETC